MIERTVLAGGVPVQIAGDNNATRAMIVIQEAFGVNDHIRDVTQRFADAGFFAVAPELFHRDGSPEIAYDDFPSAMAPMGNLAAGTIESDIRATIGYLEGFGFRRDNIGIVGYCMGGTVALFVDSLALVGAAVTFYGGGVTTGRFGFPPLVELATQLEAPWLGLYGDLDKGIPVEQVEALREAAALATVETKVVRYVDADHGFHCDQRPGSFNETAAHDAAAQAYAFFATNLKDR
jgi:carboxymethylenebutenolidase